MGFKLLHRDVDGAGNYRYRQYSNGVVEILQDPSGRAQGKKLYAPSNPLSAITREIGEFHHSSFAANNVPTIIQNHADNTMALARFLGGKGRIRRAGIVSPGVVEIVRHGGSPEYNDHFISSFANIIPQAHGVTRSIGSEWRHGNKVYRIGHRWSPGEPSEPYTVGSTMTQRDFLGALAPRQRGYTATDDLWQLRQNLAPRTGDAPPGVPVPQGDPSRPQAPQYRPNIQEQLISHMPGADPLSKATNYALMVAALVVGGGGYLFWRGMKKSRGSGARVRVVETGEVLEVDPKLIEISRFAGEEGEFDALTIKRDGQDVLVEMQEVQDDPDPQAAPQAARRIMGRSFSKKPVGSGNSFESMQQSMRGLGPHTTPQEERRFDELVKKAYSQGGEQVDEYFSEIGF